MYKLLALPLLVAFVVLAVPTDRGYSHTNYQQCGDTTLTTSTPGEIPDSIVHVGLGLGDDCRYTPADVNAAYPGGGFFTAKSISFSPIEFSTGDELPPPGTDVATLTVKSTLGLLMNPCNSFVTLGFTIKSGVIKRDNPPTVTILPPGTPNRQKPMSQDADGNGIQDGIDHWPTFLDDYFQNENIDPSKLRGRGVAINTKDIANLAVVLQFLLFEPGTVISNIPTDPRLGFPLLIVLQDPSAAASPQDPVTDLCTPLEADAVVFGDLTTRTPEGTSTTIQRKNPPSGTYFGVGWSASFADFDDDGFENLLDACWEQPNPAFEPRGVRMQPEDPDGDGLDNTCDPCPNLSDPCNKEGYNQDRYNNETEEPVPDGIKDSDGVSQCCASGTDEDGDRWSNRSDNCPLVPNGKDKPGTPVNDIQLDTDDDFIGDACDPNPTVLDGHFFSGCRITEYVIGAGGPPKIPLSVLETLQPCGSAPLFDPNSVADDDGDLVVNTIDQCPGTPAGVAVDAIGCTPTQLVEDSDNDKIVNSKDICPGSPAGSTVDAGGCTTAQRAALNATTNSGGGGVGGPGDTGIGSLSAGTGAPGWVVLMTALGAGGVIAAMGIFASRLSRRRE